MTIIYVVDKALPPFRARAIQIINTCYELAKKGAEVYLLVGKSARHSIRLEEYYGLPPLENLHIIELPQWEFFLGINKLPLKELYYLPVLAKIWQLSGSKTPTVVIMRENLKLARFMLKFRKRLNLQIFYDADDTVNFLIKREYILNHVKDKAKLPRKRKEISRTKALEKEVLTGMDGIFCVTERQRRVLQAVFKPDCPVIVVPNGVRLDENVSGYRAGKEPKEVLYIGHLYLYEGVGHLIEAMDYLKNKKVNLSIVGGLKDSSEYADTKEFVRQHQLEDRIKFLDFVPPRQLNSVAIRADILVMPLVSNRLISKHFASPMKLFHYMSMRRPIVATDLPSVREILSDRVNAILVKTDDSKALAEGIKLILDDAKLAERISEQAFIDVQGYTWENRAQKMLDLLVEYN